MMKFSLKNSLLKSKVYVILGLVFLIILWEISAIIINNNIYLPRIEEVFSSILLSNTFKYVLTYTYENQ